MTIEERALKNASTRPFALSLGRGWKRRCPACGAGQMFKSYLKVHDVCPVCAEELHHHHADDGPAYLTILIVGHLIAPLILYVFIAYRPAPLNMATLFIIGTVALSLWLLPRLKGVIIGLQWAKEMYGFREVPSKEN